MKSSITITLIILILPLLIIVGGVFLQIFLSKKESRWPGIILPIITFVFSLVPLLSYSAFIGMSIGTVFVQLAMVLIIFNLPTFILIAIYLSCREKIKVKNQLDKMNVQDL